MKTKLLFTFLILFVIVFTLGFFSLSGTKTNPETGKATARQFEKLPASTLAYYHAGWEFLRTRDPKTNEIPAGIKARELEFVSGIPKKEGYFNREQQVPEQYRSQVWESMGPDNVSGRTLCIGLDVNNEDVIMAGSASGGLWRSTDGGQSWTKVTPNNAVQSVTCIKQDLREGKTDTWYYGTGELTSTTDRQFSIFPRTLGFGNGIYKSTDNGLSWTLLESTSGGIAGELTESFQGVWNIALDATNQEKDIVYVAGYGGILRSEDGGESWTYVLGDEIIKSYCTDVVISPEGVLYAALGTFSTNESGLIPSVFGLWKSTDGINWTSITPDGFPSHYRTIKLEIPASNPHALYVFTENPIADPDPVVGFSASEHTLWKATDLNTENPVWVELTENLPGKGKGNIMPSALNPLHGYNSIGGYAMTLKAHPNDENLLFLGGTNLFRNSSGFTDSTTTKLLGGYPYDGLEDNLHPDLHNISVSPANPQVMYVASDGGVFKTTDCLADSVMWTFQSEAMVVTQFYWVGIDHAASQDNFVLGGCQDNAIYYHDLYFPSLNWKSIMGGDGMTSMVADGKSYAIVSVYSGNIFSLTFDEDMNIVNDFYQTPEICDGGDFNFFTTFVIDRADNKHFYMAAKNRILRKDDMEASAYDTTLINDGWQWLDNTGLGEEEFITAINTSKEPANILYYGTYNGKVFRMDDAHIGNPVATELTSELFPVNGFVGYIEVDPDNADNVIVVFSNYNVQSIFSSDDGGQSWTHQGGNLEEYADGSGGGPSVRCVRMLHYNDGTAYFAATSVGLFSTTKLEGDQTVWVQEGADLIGNLIVDNIDLRETDGWIVAATQGGGIFSTSFDPALSVDEFSGNSGVELTNYPNPFRDQTTIEYRLDRNSEVILSLLDVNGRLVKTLFHGQQQAGRHSVKLNGSGLSRGTYLIRLQANNAVYTRKVVVGNRY